MSLPPHGLDAESASMKAVTRMHSQRRPFTEVPDWLPDGRKAAVVFTIDDVHPGTSADVYEAGGDLGNGARGLVRARSFPVWISKSETWFS